MADSTRRRRSEAASRRRASLPHSLRASCSGACAQVGLEAPSFLPRLEPAPEKSSRPTRRRAASSGARPNTGARSTEEPARPRQPRSPTPRTSRRSARSSEAMAVLQQARLMHGSDRAARLRLRTARARVGPGERRQEAAGGGRRPGQSRLARHPRARHRPGQGRQLPGRSVLRAGERDRTRPSLGHQQPGARLHDERRAAKGEQLLRRRRPRPAAEQPRCARTSRSCSACRASTTRRRRWARPSCRRHAQANTALLRKMVKLAAKTAASPAIATAAPAWSSRRQWRPGRRPSPKLTARPPLRHARRLRCAQAPSKRAPPRPTMRGRRACSAPTSSIFRSHPLLRHPLRRHGGEPCCAWTWDLPRFGFAVTEPRDPGRLG